MSAGRLDCSSLESALDSLVGLLGVPFAELTNRLLASSWQPAESDEGDWLDFDEAFVRVELGLPAVPVPEQGIFFHAARTWRKKPFEHGILPLEAIEPELWRRLGELASEWCSPAQWLAFRDAMPLADTTGSKNYVSRRLFSGRIGQGPYAYVVRDAILRTFDGQPTHYLSESETVRDICDAFGELTGRDLLARFRAATEPCIVSFRSRAVTEGQVVAAVAYVGEMLRDRRLCRNANYSFDSKGEVIPPADIVRIEWLDETGVVMQPDGDMTTRARRRPT